MKDKIRTLQSKIEKDACGTRAITNLNSDKELSFRISLRGIEFRACGYSKEESIEIIKNTFTLKRTGLWITVVLCAFLLIWGLTNCQELITIFLSDTS